MKIYCKNCKNYGEYKGGIIYCNAYKREDVPWSKQKGSSIEEEYEYKDEWREKEMNEINKNNDCRYYESL